MVFAMQDHWRKHPMLAGCFKRPFPGLTMAAALVAGYYVVTGTVGTTAKLVTASVPYRERFTPGAFKFEPRPSDEDDDDDDDEDDDEDE